MSFLKSLFKSDKIKFDEITPEFIEINKTKYTGGDSFLKWLKNKYGELQTALIVAEESTGNVPQEWKDKIKLIEKNIEEEKNKLK